MDANKSGRNAVIPKPLSEPVLLERLMKERLSMRAIARILYLSLGMAYQRIADILNPFGDQIALVQGVDYEQFNRLNIEVDELWTFVHSK